MKTLLILVLVLLIPFTLRAGVVPELEAVEDELIEEEQRVDEIDRYPELKEIGEKGVGPEKKKSGSLLWVILGIAIVGGIAAAAGGGGSSSSSSSSSPTPSDGNGSGTLGVSW